MASQGVLIETDILAEFLTAPPGACSLLRLLLAELPCYTTFVQAADLYACAGDEAEHRAVEPALFGLRVLGASARYAATMGSLLRTAGETNAPGRPSFREICTAAVAVESGLPVVTEVHAEKYRRVPGVSIIEAGIVRQLLRRNALRLYVDDLLRQRST